MTLRLVAFRRGALFVHDFMSASRGRSEFALTWPA